MRSQRHCVLVYAGHLRLFQVVRYHEVLSCVFWMGPSRPGVQKQYALGFPRFWRRFRRQESLQSSTMSQIFLPCLSFLTFCNQHISSRVSSLFRSREYLLSETPHHLHMKVCGHQMKKNFLKEYIAL